MKINRLFRFGLGTLLLIVTIACVWLGREVNRVNYERQLAKSVVESGGHYIFGYQLDQNSMEAKPPLWTAVLGDGFLQEIEEVRYLGTITVANTDAGAVTTAVNRKRVPKKVLDGLSDLTGLTKLTLSNTDVTDKDIHYLKKLRKLEHLRLDGNAITKSALEQLSTLNRLKKLDIRWTQVDEDEIELVRKALPGVEVAARYDRVIPKAFWSTTQGDIPADSETKAGGSRQLRQF